MTLARVDPRLPERLPHGCNSHGHRLSSHMKIQSLGSGAMLLEVIRAWLGLVWGGVVKGCASPSFRVPLCGRWRAALLFEPLPAPL